MYQAAFGLALFVRDVCDGDLVGWIDDRLAQADPSVGFVGRGVTMRAALLEPLTNIVGTGPKIWSMILAKLLLGGDPERERWAATGALFVAVDSLVHTHLCSEAIEFNSDFPARFPRWVQFVGGGLVDVLLERPCSELRPALGLLVDKKD